MEFGRHPIVLFLRLYVREWRECFKIGRSEEVRSLGATRALEEIDGGVFSPDGRKRLVFFYGYPGEIVEAGVHIPWDQWGGCSWRFSPYPVVFIIVVKSGQQKGVCNPE